jgi:hypothetical protein
MDRNLLRLMAYEVQYQTPSSPSRAEFDDYAVADDFVRDHGGSIWRVTREPVRSTQMPVGDLPDWKQMVAEDFLNAVPVGGFAPGNGGYLPSSNPYGTGSSHEMRVYPNGGASNNRGYYHAAETLSVKAGVAGANGVLDVHCKWGTIPGQTAARGKGAAFWFPGPDNRWSKGPYYRAEFRSRSVDFNVQTGTNYGAVGLFIDGQTWPKGGELDNHENDLGPDERPKGYHHHADPTFTSSNWTQEAFQAPHRTRMGDWHIYTTEWTPGRVRYLVDDVVVLDTTRKCPSIAMPYVIQCSSHGAEPLPTTEGHFQVDWVTLYSYAP